MLAGMSWCDVCLLPWIPSLSVVSEDELSEVSLGDSERCDAVDCPVAHSADHLPLLYRETVCHQTGGGRNTVWSHSVFLLVPPPDVHLPALPQTLPQHQRAQAHDCCLDALSPRQHSPGEAQSVAAGSLTVILSVQIRSAIVEHYHIKTAADKVYLGCAIVNTICQVSPSLLILLRPDCHVCRPSTSSPSYRPGTRDPASTRSSP